VRKFAPILFNLYISGIPSSSFNLFQYADNMALADQKFEECKIHLEKESF
jgi:hypothetical protein